MTRRKSIFSDFVRRYYGTKKISKSTEYSRYTHRWLKTDIVPIDNGTLAVSIYDVTDQYGELSEARDMLARTGRIARVGGWEKDLVNNRDYWSEVTKEIHEVPPDFDANSVPRFHFYDRGENHAALVQAVNHSYATGEPFDVQTRIITARGNKRWVRVLGYPTLKDGKPVYVHGIFSGYYRAERAAAASGAERCVSAADCRDLGFPD